MMPDYEINMPIQVAYKVPGEKFEFKGDVWYIDGHRISEQFRLGDIQGYSIDARSGGSELGNTVFILSDYSDQYLSGGYVPTQGQVAVNQLRNNNNCPDIAAGIYLLYYKGSYYPAIHSSSLTRVFPFAIGGDSMKHDIGEIQFYLDTVSSEVQLLNIVLFGKLKGAAGVFTNDQVCAHSALAMGTINLAKGVLTYIMPDYVGFVATDQLDYIESDSTLLHLSNTADSAVKICADAISSGEEYIKAGNHAYFNASTPLPKLTCRPAPNLGIISGRNNLSRFVKSDEDYFTLEYLPYMLSITCDSDVQMITLILGYIAEFKLLCKSANLSNSSVTLYLNILRAVLCELLASQLCSIKPSSESLVYLKQLLSVGTISEDSIWQLSGSELTLKNPDELKHIFSGLDVYYAFPDAVTFYLEQDLVLSRNLTVSADALMRSDFTEIAYEKLARRFNSQISFKSARSLSNAKENFRIGLGGTGQRKLPSSIPFGLGIVERDAVYMSQAYMGTISDPSMILMSKNGLLEFEMLGPYAIPYLSDLLITGYDGHGSQLLYTFDYSTGLCKDIHTSFTNLVYEKMRTLAGTKVNVRDDAVMHRISSDYGLKTYRSWSDDTRARVKERVRIMLAAERSARLTINFDSFCYHGGQYSSVGYFGTTSKIKLPPRDSTSSGTYVSSAMASTLSLLNRFYHFTTLGTPLNVINHDAARVRFTINGMLIMSGLAPLMSAIPSDTIGVSWKHEQAVQNAVVMLIDIWQRLILGDIVYRASGIDAACKYRTPNNANICVEKYHAYPQLFVYKMKYGWQLVDNDIKFRGTNLVKNNRKGKSPFIPIQDDNIGYGRMIDDLGSRATRAFADFLIAERDSEVKFDHITLSRADLKLKTNEDIIEKFEPSESVRYQYQIPGTKVTLRPSCWADETLEVQPFTSANVVYSMSYISSRVNAILALSDENSPNSFFTKYTEFYEKLVSLLLPVFSSEDSAYVGTALYIFNAYLQKVLPEFTFDAALAALSQFRTIDDLFRAADAVVISSMPDVKSVEISRKILFDKVDFKELQNSLWGTTDEDEEGNTSSADAGEFSLDDLIKDMNYTSDKPSEPVEEVTLASSAKQINSGVLNELQPRFKFLSDVGDIYNQERASASDTQGTTLADDLLPESTDVAEPDLDLSAFESANTESESANEESESADAEPESANVEPESANEESDLDLSAFESANTEPESADAEPDLDLSAFESANEEPALDLSAFESASEEPTETEVQGLDFGDSLSSEGTTGSLDDLDFSGTAIKEARVQVTVPKSEIPNLGSNLVETSLEDLLEPASQGTTSDDVDPKFVREFLGAAPDEDIDLGDLPSDDKKPDEKEEDAPTFVSADSDDILGGLSLAGDISSLTTFSAQTPEPPKKIFTDMPPLAGEYQIPVPEPKVEVPEPKVADAPQELPGLSISGEGIPMGELEKPEISSDNPMPDVGSLLGNAIEMGTINDVPQPDETVEEPSEDKSSQGELLFNPKVADAVADSWTSARERKLRFGRLLIISPEDKSSVQCGYCGGSIKDIEKFCSLNDAFVYLDTEYHMLINIRGQAHLVYAYYSAPRELMNLIDEKQFSLDKFEQQFSLKQVTLDALV